MLRIALTLAFIVIPAFVVFAAGDVPDAIPQYGVTGLLTAAMAGMGWVIRSSLTQQIAVMKQQAASNARLALAVLTVAQELIKRPCVAMSKEIKDLAAELLAGKEGKEEQP